MILDKKKYLIIFILFIIYFLFFNIFSMKVHALDLGSPNLLKIYTKYSSGELSDEYGLPSWSTTDITKFKISESYFTENDFEYNMVANYSGQAIYRAKGFLSKVNASYKPYTNHFFVFSVYSRVKLDTVNPYIGDDYRVDIGNITCRAVETVTSSDSPHYFYNFNCNTNNINRGINYIGIRFHNDNDILYSPINFGISNFYSFDNETGANDFFTSLVDTTSDLTNEDVNAIDNVVRDILGFLEDDNLNSSEGGATISFYENQLPSDNTITNLLTLPITLLNSIVNGIQTTCSTFNLGNLFGHDIIFPCLNLQQYLGTALWSTIDFLMCGFMIYNIAMKLISIFLRFTSLDTSIVDELYVHNATRKY